jgi:hypothetical protein
MAAFEVICEGYLGISAHWHLFWYFFMFACLKDGSRAATIDCANLRMKQVRGDGYISSSLTSSNSGWHKGWFYLRNDPEFTPLAFTGNTIWQTRSNGPMVPRRRSRTRCSRSTGRCWGASEEPGSPWRPSLGSTTPEESSRFGGGRSAFVR